MICFCFLNIFNFNLGKREFFPFLCILSATHSYMLDINYSNIRCFTILNQRNFLFSILDFELDIRWPRPNGEHKKKKRMTTSRSFCSSILTVLEVSVNTKLSKSSKLAKSIWMNAKLKTSSTKLMLTEEAKLNKISLLSSSKEKSWKHSTKKTSCLNYLSSFCLPIKRQLVSLSSKKCFKILDKALRIRKYRPWFC